MNFNALYYREPMRQEYKGTITALWVRPDQTLALVTDETCFYPEGGGQPGDRGTISWKGGQLQVIDTRFDKAPGEKTECIAHICTWPKGASEAQSGVQNKSQTPGQDKGQGQPSNQPQTPGQPAWDSLSLKVGDPVQLQIDFDRRFAMMQMHSAEHLVSGLAHQWYGCNNVGFHINEEEMVIDFDKALGEAEIRRLEEGTNREIWANKPIEVLYPKEEDLANIPYRSKKPLSGQVRLIHVEGVDTCACCGTHLDHTGEIGLLKIRHFESHRGGTRLSILAGKWAWEYLQEVHDQAQAVGQAFSTSLLDIEEATQAQMTTVAELKGRIMALTQDHLKQLLKRPATGLADQATGADQDRRADQAIGAASVESLLIDSHVFLFPQALEGASSSDLKSLSQAMTDEAQALTPLFTPAVDKKGQACLMVTLNLGKLPDDKRQEEEAYAARLVEYLRTLSFQGGGGKGFYSGRLPLDTGDLQKALLKDFAPEGAEGPVPERAEGPAPEKAKRSAPQGAAVQAHSEAQPPTRPRPWKRFVLKVGSSTVCRANGKLNLRLLDQLVLCLADLKGEGYEIVLVTSGAIAVGVNRMGLPERPSDMPTKQATAAVGQCELMYIYEKLFNDYGYTTAQILLTKDIMERGDNRKNVENTFEALLSLGTIPIVNENDSIAYDEIAYGDNDTLSAIVASLLGADGLILFTDIDGLYDADPRQDPQAKLISHVSEIDDRIHDLAAGKGSKWGTGGMATKIQAAEIAMAHDIEMIICQGDRPKILFDILDGKPIGTCFSKYSPTDTQ